MGGTQQMIARLPQLPSVKARLISTEQPRGRLTREASATESSCDPCQTFCHGCDSQKTALLEEENCAVCLDVLSSAEQRTLPCGHSFHSACVDVWLARNPCCPLCRAVVTPDSSLLDMALSSPSSPLSPVSPVSPLASSPAAAQSEMPSGFQILEETISPDYEPSEAEVHEYAVWLGVNVETESYLLAVCREGLLAPIPEPWRACRDVASGDVYYFNFETAESVWDHPVDTVTRQAVERARRTHQRQQRRAERARRREFRRPRTQPEPTAAVEGHRESISPGPIPPQQLRARTGFSRAFPLVRLGLVVSAQGAEAAEAADEQSAVTVVEEVVVEPASCVRQWAGGLAFDCTPCTVRQTGEGRAQSAPTVAIVSA